MRTCVCAERGAAGRAWSDRRQLGRGCGCCCWSGSPVGHNVTQQPPACGSAAHGLNATHLEGCWDPSADTPAAPTTDSLVMQASRFSREPYCMYKGWTSSRYIAYGCLRRPLIPIPARPRVDSWGGVPKHGSAVNTSLSVGRCERTQLLTWHARQRLCARTRGHPVAWAALGSEAHATQREAVRGSARSGCRSACRTDSPITSVSA